MTMGVDEKVAIMCLESMLSVLWEDVDEGTDLGRRECVLGTVRWVAHLES